jgi:hypothetical protein
MILPLSFIIEVILLINDNDVLFTSKKFGLKCAINRRQIGGVNNISQGERES